MNNTIEQQGLKGQEEEFPAYKVRPVTIAGFFHEATIMLSKEKPKKIGIKGSDG